MCSSALALHSSQLTVCLAGRVQVGAVWRWGEGVVVLGMGGGVTATGTAGWVWYVAATGMAWGGEVGVEGGDAGLVFLVRRVDWRPGLAGMVEVVVVVVGRVTVRDTVLVVQVDVWGILGRPTKGGG